MVNLSVVAFDSTLFRQRVFASAPFASGQLALGRS